MGFTNADRRHSIDYGSSCILLNTQYAIDKSSYIQEYPKQIYQPQYPYGTKDVYSPNAQVKEWLLQMFFTDIYRHKHTQPPEHESFLVKTLKGKYPTKNYLNKNFGETLAKMSL